MLVNEHTHQGFCSEQYLPRQSATSFKRPDVRIAHQIEKDAEKDALAFLFSETARSLLLKDGFVARGEQCTLIWSYSLVIEPKNTPVVPRLVPMRRGHLRPRACVVAELAVRAPKWQI
jgi:hypothetical protein